MDKAVMILRKCHISAKYKGYRYIPDAVDLVAELMEQKDIIRMTRDIYPVIAEKYHTSPCNIEAAIRNTIEKCWKNNKTYVQEILGYKPLKCPSNTEFIDAIVFYIKYSQQPDISYSAG